MRVLGGILLLLGAVFGQEIRPHDAASPPLVDGRLDEEAWNDAPITTVATVDHIHPQYRENWDGPRDLSFSIRALRHAEDLYLAFTVQDEATGHDSGQAWWVGDSIELFFDTDLVSEEDDSHYSNDDFQLFVMPFHDGQRWGVVARGPDRGYPAGGLRGLEVASQRTETGYTVEVRLPLWTLHPLRPDALGRIGFDVALNDVDEGGQTLAETYMTLSGRFELFATPSNFGRLRVGAVTGGDEPSVAGGFDWFGLLLGIALVLIAAAAARDLVRRLRSRSRLRAVSIATVLGAGAAFCLAFPALASWLDARQVRGGWDETRQHVQATAATCLDLDTGGDNARARRVLALLRDGQVRIRPHFQFRLCETGTRGGGIRYGISLPPGGRRTFPLEGWTAPDRTMKLVFAPIPTQPREASELPALRLRLDFEEGPPLEFTYPRDGLARCTLDLSDRAGQPLRALQVRNLLPSTALVLDRIESETGGLPLAAVTHTGVPLDIWHDRPARYLARVETTRSFPVGANVDRLWLALSAEGAYPRTPHGEEVAVVSVIYADGAGPQRRLINGVDLADHPFAFARQAEDPDSVALIWEGVHRLPRHYSLVAIDVDAARTVERVEVENRGVLEMLAVVALTAGRRQREAPSPTAPVQLRGDRLAVREQVRARWQGAGFVVHSPAGLAATTGRSTGVELTMELPFGEGRTGRLSMWLPRGSTASALLRNQAFLQGLAALLLAFAILVLGSTQLRHARKLRVKMLTALGAATVVPLVFLVVSLTNILNDRAERDLEAETRADLQRAGERIRAAAARARELAYAVRDTPDPDRSRAELEAKGGFLRLPGVDAAGPSPLGNVAFIDTIQRSGLYYSPWDGLMAIGLARTPGRRRCVVGLRAGALLGTPASPETSVILFSPDGDPLAAPRGLPRRIASRAAIHAQRERLAQLARTGHVLYEPHATLRGEAVSAAHELLREGDRTVGMLSVFRSRARRAEEKAAVLRIVLLSSLAALLLVVIAGATLVERVTDRLQRVTRAARSLSKGDLKSRVPVESEDEVGRLASSFNTMADALDARVHQLTEMHRVLHELTTALDRRSVAQAAADLLLRTTRAKHAVVAAMAHATDRLEVIERRGEGVPLGPRLPETGPERDAVELRRTIVKERAVFVPLVAAGRTVGLAICSPVHHPEELDRAFLDASGRQIGIALENARLYEAAVTDELTGLYTLAFFVRRLKEEVDRASASQTPLSLLRIQLPVYRHLRETHGPALASKLIAETAQVLASVLPRRHILAHGRSGELMALLVDSDRNGARRARERIAAAIDRHEFTWLRGEPRPAVSFRSVTYPEDGAAADILLDTLYEVSGAWEDTSTEAEPPLSIPAHLGAMVAGSAAMRAAIDVVSRVAATDATVLLSGETGSGKEVIADLIQANSKRRERPYVKVNCAAIPETLLETELFGHERGAFTGAARQRHGRFEQAHRGTIFLDEIGDLPLSMQSKLLRVLQEREIMRVGGNEQVAVDLRIIAATNRDLAADVRTGRFREDLYHRLHVIELVVPALRDRREDIAPLIEQFRVEFNGRHGLAVEALAPDALDSLYRYDWPGNVRELRNVIERSMLLAGGAIVEHRHLALPREPEAAQAPRIDGLSPRQERILAYARRKGGATNSDIVHEEGVSPRTALRELQRLVERGLLVRVGRRRGATYRPV